jgi:nucleotide-binding universal stress UspA family protein
MYKNILVPVDLDHGDAGAGALMLARHIGGPEATITLLTVTDDDFSSLAAHVPDDVHELHDRDIRTRLKALAHEVDESAVVVLRHGKPSRAILEEAEVLGADAIVLTSHRPNFRNHMLGTTASRVAQHATCSVVIDRSNV